MNACTSCQVFKSSGMFKPLVLTSSAPSASNPTLLNKVDDCRFDRRRIVLQILRIEEIALRLDCGRYN
jgi:hypothetical protein